MGHPTNPYAFVRLVKDLVLLETCCMRRLLFGSNWIYPRRAVFVLPVLALLIDQVVKVILFQTGDYIINILWFWLPVGSSFFLVINFIFVILVAVAWIRSRFRFSIGFILAGGASNLIDRLVHGGVIDYLFIGSFAFNISDLLIWVGCLLVLVYHDKKYNETFF